MMRIDVYHHFTFESVQLDRIEASLSNITTLVSKGLTMDKAIQDALDENTAKVTALETVEGSAVALLQGLKSALDTALANSDPAAVVAAVKAISARIGTDTDSLAAAVAANTPSAP